MAHAPSEAPFRPLLTGDSRDIALGRGRKFPLQMAVTVGLFAFASPGASREVSRTQNCGAQLRLQEYLGGWN